VKMKYQKIF